MRSGKTEMIDFVENLFFILIETICCCLYFQTFSKFRFTKKIQITPRIAGFNTFLYYGLQTTTATNALLINSSTPIFIIILGTLIFRTAIFD